MTYDQLMGSIRDALLNPGQPLEFLLFIILLAVAVVIIRIAVFYYARYMKTRQIIHPEKQALRPPPKHSISEFNTAQKKAVMDIIAEFKRREIIAEAIPMSVLEKFSEYFYRHINRVNISNSLSRKIEQKIFPLLSGSEVEIEFYDKDKIYNFQRKVLNADGKNIVLNNPDSSGIKLVKGLQVSVFYTVNNRFISGESAVLRLVDFQKAVLTYPSKLKVSDERTFSRVLLKNVKGEIGIADKSRDFKTNINVIDISLEGARVKTDNALKKNVVYRCVIEDREPSIDVEPLNLECVVTRSFSSDDNRPVYGMAFVYLDQETRSRLTEFIDTIKARNAV